MQASIEDDSMNLMKPWVAKTIGGSVGVLTCAALIFGLGAIGVRFGIRAMLWSSGAFIGIIFGYCIWSGVRSVRTYVFWNRVGRRMDAGECVGCGYSLRGTPERCPECGLCQSEETLAEFALKKWKKLRC